MNNEATSDPKKKKPAPAPTPFAPIAPAAPIAPIAPVAPVAPVAPTAPAAPTASAAKASKRTKTSRGKKGTSTAKTASRSASLQSAPTSPVAKAAKAAKVAKAPKNAKRAKKSLLNSQLSQPISFHRAPRNAIPDQEIKPLSTPRVTLKHQAMRVRSTPIKPVALQATKLQTLAPQAVSRITFNHRSAELPPLKEGVARLAHASSLEPFDSKAVEGFVAKSHRPLPTIEPSISKNAHSMTALPPIVGNLGAEQPPAAWFESDYTSEHVTQRPSLNVERSRTSAAEPQVTPMFPLADGAQDGRSPKSVGTTQQPFLDRARSTDALKPDPKLDDLAAAPEQSAFDERVSLLATKQLSLKGQQVDLHPVPAVQKPVRTRTSRVKKPREQ